MSDQLKAAQERRERRAARGPGFSKYAAHNLEIRKVLKAVKEPLTVESVEDLGKIEDPETRKYAFVKGADDGRGAMYVYTGVGDGIGEADGWSKVIVGPAPADALPHQMMDHYTQETSDAVNAQLEDMSDL